VRSARLLLALLSLALWACLTPENVIDARTYAPPGRALERVAVIPFYAHHSYQGSNLMGGVSAATASAQVTHLVSQELAERGIDVVPEADVAAAIAKVPRSTPAIDAVIFAEIAARELGATGVLLGEVLRFREPRGASAAARRPASVAYHVTFYETPDAFKLWSARFDETHDAPSPELRGADHAEETGIEWKSATQIARRGAAAVAKSLSKTR